MKAALFALFSPFWAVAVISLFVWLMLADLIEFVTQPEWNPFRRTRKKAL